MNVTIAQLNTQGYLTSNLVNQDTLNRCVNDTIAAYIVPILPTYSDTDTDVINAVYCISYMLLLQRNIVKTRFDAVKKTDANSFSVSNDQIAMQYAATADMYLQVLKTKVGAAETPKVKDLARIYFLTNLI